jgi:hypothetical protein
MPFRFQASPLIRSRRFFIDAAATLPAMPPLMPLSLFSRHFIDIFALSPIAPRATRAQAYVLRAAYAAHRRATLPLR